MRAYAAYLFDLDGTLVDTAPDLNAAVNHALASAGLAPVDESLTRHWVGHGARVLVAQALKHQGAENHPADPLYDAFLHYYAAHVAELSQPYPQVAEALSALAARGARLAVVTNKLSRFTQALLPRVGLAEFFDLVVCGDTAAAPKPAADPALHACAALGIEPRNALFVGDSNTDVQCARGWMSHRVRARRV